MIKRTVLCASAFAAGAMLTGMAAAPSGASVDVTVTDLRNSKGTVRACMTSAEQAFPKCQGVKGAHRATLAARGTVTFSFEGVKPGTYAIALLHDENNNGKADRALSMIPTEGYGFSRDAKVVMGPPSFADAAFAVAGSDQRQTIRMRYF